MIKSFFTWLVPLVFILAVAPSCSDDNAEDLAPQPAECDTTAITFSGTVTPILAINCYGCHSTSIAEAGVVLDTYAGVKEQVDHGHLVGVISHAPGFPPMPQGAAKLSDCDIAKIKEWVELGAPNN